MQKKHIFSYDIRKNKKTSSKNTIKIVKIYKTGKNKKTIKNTQKKHIK